MSTSVYFAGGLFCNTGAYASRLQVLNAPRHSVASGSLVTRRWRWWAYEPMRVDRPSTVTLFTGTLVFAVNLPDSFRQDLTTSRATGRSAQPT